MKKVFGIIGAGVIWGGVALTIYLLNNKKKEHTTCQEEKDIDKEASSVAESSLDKTMPTQEEQVYENVKSSAIGNMYSRHEEAVTIMKDSIEAIRENVKVSENTNNKIEDISIELDKMLSED